MHYGNPPKSERQTFSVFDRGAALETSASRMSTFLHVAVPVSFTAGGHEPMFRVLHQQSLQVAQLVCGGLGVKLILQRAAIIGQM